MKPSNNVYVGSPPMDDPDYPTCQICESEFTSKHELELHMRRKHEIEDEDE